MPDAPTFNLLTIIVKDMEASVAFYRRLGLHIPDGEPPWDALHRSADFPGGISIDFDSVEFVTKWNAGYRGPATGTMGVIGFQVATREAVDELFADLTGAGSASSQPPFDAFWGARYAIVDDPDGNAVGLMSPIDPAMRSAPPAP